MNITDLATKLKHNNINIELNKESINFPVLLFNKASLEFKFFYRENFIKRTKFHRMYNTFLEITSNEKSKLLILKSNYFFSCKYSIEENKIYFNVSKVEENKMINLILKLNESDFQ
jgi:hypothetical protein